MSNDTIFPRGSEWRKWDLHVHTPDSIIHHYKKGDANDVWEKYILDLESLDTNIKVLGINDYLFLDGYKKVLEYKKEGRLQNIKLILPVIELRLTQFSGKDFQKINFHVIFSDKLDPVVIEQQFINALSPKYELSSDLKTKWHGIITRNSLIDFGNKIIESTPEKERSKFGTSLKEGFSNLTIAENTIRDVLNSHYFDNKYITAIGKTEWSDWKWSDGSIATKKDIINSVDIVFTASESIEKFHNSKQSLTNAEVNDLLLDCSDAHHNLESTEKDRLGNCNTWIKADTTFEGLKQIIYEPDERVRIQELQPEEKPQYQVIDTISISNENIDNDEIKLNSNLNCIIGGKSTGKSMLLGALAHKFNAYVHEDTPEYISELAQSMTITWKDGSQEIKDRKIDYFHQGYMSPLNNGINDSLSLNNRILDIFMQDSQKEKIYYERESKFLEIKKRIASDIVTLFSVKEKYKKNINHMQSYGNKESIEREITSLQEKINDIHAISSSDSESYQDYCKNISDLEESLAIHRNNMSKLNLLKNEIPQIIPPSVAELENFSELKNIYDLNKVELITKLITAIDNIMQNTTSEINKANTDKSTIEQNSQYIALHNKVMENAEYDTISRKINEQKNLLTSIEQLNLSIENNKSELEAIKNTILNCHNNYYIIDKNLAQELLEEKLDLKISSISTLNRKAFIQGIEGCLLANKGSNEYFIDGFLITLKDSTSSIENSTYQEWIKEILVNVVDGKFSSFKSGKTEQDLLNSILMNCYDLEFIIEYEGDRYDMMSEGKQAFVILKLLLEFSKETYPLLIDQPEDDLDNRSIYKELVRYLKEKKKDRQIILVTHNPNIVIGADTEEVIVANQQGTKTQNKDGKKFQYFTGSLENTYPLNSDENVILYSQGIREHVCEILEGGELAFEKRKNRYQMQ